MVKLLIEKQGFDKKYAVTLILLGLLAYSPISTFIIMNLLHFPMSLPEVFVLFMYPFLPKQFKRNIHFNRFLFCRLLFLLVLLLTIGLYIGNYSTKNLFGTFRIYFDMIFYISIFSSKQGFNFNIVTFICLGSLLGWLINCFLTLDSYFASAGDSENVTFVSLGNILAIPLGLFSSSLSKNNKLFLAIILCSLLICVFSAVRRPLVVMLFALFLLFLSRQFSGQIKRWLLIILTSLVVSLPALVSFLEVNYPILYYRLYVKTIEFVQGDSNQSDDYRKMRIAEFKLSGNLLPRGLVTRDTLNDLDGGAYIDYPFMEYFYTFGLIIYIVLLCLFRDLYRLWRFYRRNKDLYLLMIILMFMIFGLLSFLEGTFLSSTYTVPFTGYVIGQFVYFKKLNRRSYKGRAVQT